MDPFLYGDHVAAPTDPSVVTSSRGARRDVDAHGAHAGRPIDGRYFCQSLRANVETRERRRGSREADERDRIRAVVARGRCVDSTLDRDGETRAGRGRGVDRGGRELFFYGFGFRPSIRRATDDGRDGREGRRRAARGAKSVSRRRDSCRLSTRSIGGVRAQQPQIVLLREGTDSSQGRGQCVSNINACCAVADAVRRRWGREDWINSCETNAGTPPFRTTVRPL